MPGFTCPHCHAALNADPGTLAVCGICGRAVTLPEIIADPLPEEAEPQTAETVPAETGETPHHPAHTALELAEAEEKRARWSLITLVIAGVQIILIAAGMCYPALIVEHPSLSWFWVLIPAVGAAVISGLRPDDAYLEQPPRPKSRLMLFVFILAALLIGTWFFSVLMFGVREILNGFYR